MASLMENLIEVLNNESQEYDQLLELSTKKTPVLVAGNLEELARITDEEQLVASRITHLERKRQEVFADIANVINRDVKTLLLPDLIEILAQRPEEHRISRSVARMEHDEQTGMDPAKAGAFIAKVAMKRRVKPIYTIRFDYQFLALLTRILPYRFLNWLIGVIYGK